jgi:hypothetical protein
MERKTKGISKENSRRCPDKRLEKIIPAREEKVEFQ